MKSKKGILTDKEIGNIKFIEKQMNKDLHSGENVIDEDEEMFEAISNETTFLDPLKTPLTLIPKNNNLSKICSSEKNSEDGYSSSYNPRYSQY